MKTQFITGLVLALSFLFVATPSFAGEERPLSYQIMSVQVVGSGSAEKAAVMLEQQTGRSWMLMQRGGGAPVWQALTFESSYSLNQQTVPPELGRVMERREQAKP